MPQPVRRAARIGLPELPPIPAAAPSVDAPGTRLDRAPLEGRDAPFLERIRPPFEALYRYARPTVQGIENLPRGAAQIASNHTGFLGLDYVLLALSVRHATGRDVQGVAHENWFRFPLLGGFSQRIGLIPPDKAAMCDVLRRGELLVIFPEGATGAFRTTDPDQPYELTRFHGGFVRAALLTGTPIVPAAVIGGAEANPTLALLRFTERKWGLPLPLPLTVIPLPVKWRIRFLAPVHLHGFGPADASDRRLVDDIARRVQGRIKDEIARQLRIRGRAF